MKVNCKTERAFQPITIEITIESQDELYSLYHRTNLNNRVLRPVWEDSKSKVPFPVSDEADALWDVLAPLVGL